MKAFNSTWIFSRSFRLGIFVLEFDFFCSFGLHLFSLSYICHVYTFRRGGNVCDTMIFISYNLGFLSVNRSAFLSRSFFFSLTFSLTLSLAFPLPLPILRLLPHPFIPIHTNGWWSWKCSSSQASPSGRERSCLCHDLPEGQTIHRHSRGHSRG